MKGRIMALCLLILLCAQASALCFTDANGRAVDVESPQRVVSLYNSYGDAWTLAGGKLAGSIADAFEDASLQGAVNLGSHLSPNLELLFSLNPDFVLLSADVSSHREIAALLEAAEIPCAFFSTPDYQSYMNMMQIFCEINDRPDLYQRQIETVQRPIQTIIAEAQALPDSPSALLIRANSTSVKCKGSEGSVAGYILRDLGFHNLADGDHALCESIGMERVIVEDPDYIFVVLQGANTEAAEKNLAATLWDNPAWSGLTAVREGRFYMLDRALYHYHPNERWAQAYEWIFEIRKGANEK